MPPTEMQRLQRVAELIAMALERNGWRDSEVNFGTPETGDPEIFFHDGAGNSYALVLHPLDEPRN